MSVKEVISTLRKLAGPSLLDSEFQAYYAALAQASQEGAPTAAEAKKERLALLEQKTWLATLN